MAQSWYIRAQSRVVGPISSKRLQELAGVGQLTADHFVSLDGQNWKPASSVKGLQFVSAEALPSKVSQTVLPCDTPTLPSVANPANTTTASDTTNSGSKVPAYLRLVAFGLDVFIAVMTLVGVYSLLVAGILTVGMMMSAQTRRDFVSLGDKVPGLLLLGLLGYMLFRDIPSNKSLGKWAVGLRIVPDHCGRNRLPLPYPWGRSVVIFDNNRQPPPMTASDSKRGILGRRIAAWLLDVLLMVLLSAIICGFGAVGFYWQSNATQNHLDIEPLRNGIAVLCGWLSLFVVVIYTLNRDAKRQSVGKRIMGLVVLGDQGAPLTDEQSCWRNWLLLVPLLPILETAVALLRPDGRRIGDLIAGSSVTRQMPHDE